MAQSLHAESKQGVRIKKLAMVAIVLVVLAALFMGLMFVQPWAPKNNSSTENVLNQPKLNPVERASIMVDGGDYKGAQEFLDKNLLEKATTNDQKAQSYTEKALLALNNKKYDDALLYAKEADTAQHSKTALRLMAQAAKASGNKTLAVEYYKTVLSMYTVEERNSDEGALQYQSDEKALQEANK